jgi:hypothetical protein
MEINSIAAPRRNDSIKDTLLFVRIFTILLSIVMACLALARSVSAQGNVLVQTRQEYKLDRDTLVVDELVLDDSSRILLTKQVSVIRAKRILIGSGCAIIGQGEKGADGKNGRSFAEASGVCRAGLNGEPGKVGTKGRAGKYLVLETAELQIKSTLNIELAGGNGGDGGKGGNGSAGSWTTIHCEANGGSGGNGGNGGNGGSGGNIFLIVTNQNVLELAGKINLINRGGYRGLGVEGGRAGQHGTGSRGNKSKNGQAGKIGADGEYGKEGRPLFYSIVKTRVSGGVQVADGGATRNLHTGFLLNLK